MMTRAPWDAQSVQIGGRQVASVAEWVEGARLRTLPAAISPVFAGTGIAVFAGGADLLRAVLAGLVALALQRRYHEAQTRIEQELTSGWRQAYLPLGDLKLSFTGPGASGPVDRYRRQLDLGQAIASV